MVEDLHYVHERQHHARVELLAHILEELIEAADEAMYRAKRAGKNRVAGAADEAA